ncbi:MAG: bifunctional helix-turn-helix transcriptional regulator/GNAT family N-acetyltransferase [Pseudomonadota bacterium]
MALGSRLRRLGERLADNARDIYALYGIDLDPKWFPVYYALSVTDDGLSTSELAERIGHSHASVSQIVKEMRRGGLVRTSRSRNDGRVNEIRLSRSGRAIGERIRYQYLDVNAAVLQLLDESDLNLLQAVTEAEVRLDERSLTERVRAEYSARELRRVRIVDYEPDYRDAFRQLNYDWIERYFEVEPEDREALNHPEEKILAPGGYIAMALYDNRAVGTCALLRHSADTFELAKMAVSAEAQGRGIGERLGRRVIDEAKARGASRIYLESNRTLEAALRLYRRLGFRQTFGLESPYARSNIQMLLELE